VLAPDSSLSLSLSPSLAFSLTHTLSLSHTHSLSLTLTLSLTLSLSLSLSHTHSLTLSRSLSISRARARALFLSLSLSRSLSRSLVETALDTCFRRGWKQKSCVTAPSGRLPYIMSARLPSSQHFALCHPRMLFLSPYSYERNVGLGFRVTESLCCELMEGFRVLRFSGRRCWKLMAEPFLGAPLCSPARFHSQSQGTHPRGRTRTAHNRKKVESKGGASEAISTMGSPAPRALAAAVFASMGRARPRSASPGRKSPASGLRKGATSHSHSRSPKTSRSPKKKAVSSRCGSCFVCAPGACSVPACRNNLNLLSASLLLCHIGLCPSVQDVHVRSHV